MKQNTFTQKNISTAIIVATTAMIFALVPLYAHKAEAAVGGDGVRMTRSASTTPKTVNLTCMQTAVDIREDGIISAHTAYNTAIMSGLTARKSALHDAWGLTDGTVRKTAIKSAWSAWKSAHTDARADLKSSKKAVWTTFKATAKNTCKEVLPKEEAPKTDTEA